MYLSFDRYENIKKSVVEFIKKYNIVSYPLNLKEICNKIGAKLIPYSLLCEKDLEYVISKSEDGCMIKDNEEVIAIAYNDQKYGLRITTTIGHEIGHFGRNHKEQSALADSEADFFAVYLLAPLPILEREEVESYMDIYEKFNVSKELAKYSWDKYVKWKENRKKYNFDYTEYEKYLLSAIKVTKERSDIMSAIKKS